MAASPSTYRKQRGVIEFLFLESEDVANTLRRLMNIYGNVELDANILKRLFNRVNRNHRERWEIDLIDRFHNGSLAVVMNNDKAKHWCSYYRW